MKVASLPVDKLQIISSFQELSLSVKTMLKIFPMSTSTIIIFRVTALFFMINV